MSESPHTAVIHFNVFLHPVSPTGELGQPLGRRQIQDLGIKNKVTTIKGRNLEECIEKLKEKLDALSSL